MYCPLLQLLALAAVAAAVALPATPAAAAARRLDEAPSPGDSPQPGNCMGCYDAGAGRCILDTDAGGDPSCPLATPASCKAVNLPYMNKSLERWPAEAGTCLVGIAAEGKDCMPVRPAAFWRDDGGFVCELGGHSSHPAEGGGPGRS